MQGSSSENSCRIGPQNGQRMLQYSIPILVPSGILLPAAGICSAIITPVELSLLGRYGNGRDHQPHPRQHTGQSLQSMKPTSLGGWLFPLGVLEASPLPFASLLLCQPTCGVAIPINIQPVISSSLVLPERADNSGGNNVNIWIPVSAYDFFSPWRLI